MSLDGYGMCSTVFFLVTAVYIDFLAQCGCLLVRRRVLGCTQLVICCRGISRAV